MNDEENTYNVCVSEYCATLEGSVFENLTPIVSPDDAPTDNLAIISELREYREMDELDIEVDTTMHSMRVENRMQQDTDNRVLWIIMLVLSGAGIICATITLRGEHKRYDL